ncbi:hypothetical protein [Kiloniella sp.]|uniref:hypothetical protein n=1 Tax=Kiloniella sp. TaxID=1938587 RepID=UPI003B0239C2
MTDKKTPPPVKGESGDKDLVKRLGTLAKAWPGSPAGCLARKQGRLLKAFEG